MAARMAMMAMTTSSSISVKARAWVPFIPDLLSVNSRVHAPRPRPVPASPVGAFLCI